MSDKPNDQLRSALLHLHRELLTAQVIEVEKATGRTMTPNDQLAAALQDPRFLWLRELSSLLALLDAEAAAKPDGPIPEGPPALEQIETLLNPPDPDTSFGRRYLQELQNNPASVMAHRDVTALLPTDAES